jgi:hypothetical protein
LQYTHICTDIFKNVCQTGYYLQKISIFAKENNFRTKPKSYYIMKRLLYISLAVFALLFSQETKAQRYDVPSIPKQSRTVTKSGPVYGTQYDWLSVRYANYDDIYGMDKGQLRVLRNSIYARHGRKFKDKNLRAYFNTQRWYNPIYDEIPASRLNKYEKANIEFLKKLEQ